MHFSVEQIIIFLNMGGYASFVWSSYGIMLIIFLLNFLLPIKRHRTIKMKLGKKRN